MNIANLQITISADPRPLIASMSKITDIVRSGTADLSKFTDGFEKLHVVGSKFRNPAAFGGKGQFIDAAEATGIFGDALERLQQRISQLSSDVFASSPSFIHQSVAIVASSRSMEMMNRSASALMGSLSAAVNGPVQLLPSRVIHVATAVQSAVGPLDRMGFSLQRLGVANYNFLASVDKWDINGVIAGAGAAAKVLDTLKTTFLGITGPAREIQKLMSFMTPAVAGFAAQMMSLSGNPALQVFGQRLKDLAEQTQSWGDSVQMTMGQQIFGRFSALAGVSDTLVAAFTRRLFPVLGAGLSTTVRGSLGVFDQMIGKLTGVAGRGTQIFDFFGKEIRDVANDISGAFGPMTEKILRASYALIRLGTIGTAKGLYYTTLGAAKLTIVLSTLAGRGIAMAVRGFSSLTRWLFSSRKAASGGEFARLSKDMDRMAASAGRVKGGIGGLTSGMMQLFPQMSTLMTGGVIAAGVVGFGALAKSAVASADELEKGQLKYQTLLGSAAAAQERMAEITKFAAVTPFDLAEVTAADQMLQGFGIRSAEVLKVVGNAAAISGTDFSDLAKIMGQLSQSKELENINQLVDRGVLSFAELSAAGITFAKDRSIQNSVAETYEAVAKIMQAKFAGGMDALSGTVSGKFSSLKDAISQSMGKLAVSTGLVDGLKLAMDWGIRLAEFFQSTGVPIIMRSIGLIRAALTPTFTRIASVIISNFDLIVAAWTATTSMVVDVAVWLGESVWSVVTTVFGGLVSWLGTDFTGGVFASFEAFASIVQTAFLMVEYGALNWRKMLDIALLGATLGLVRFGENAKYFFGTIIPQTLSVLGQNFVIAGAWMANILSLSFVTIAESARYIFTDIIPATIRWFGENWRDIVFTSADYVLTLFINLGKNIRMLWSEVWNFIRSAGRDPIEFDFTALNEGFISTVKKFPEINDRVAGQIEERLKQITAGGPQFKALNLSPRFTSPLEDALSGELGALKKDFADGFGNFAAGRLADLPKMDSIATPAAAIAAAAQMPDIKHPGGLAESKGKGKGNQPEILSVDEAYKKLAQSALKNDTAKEQLKETKKVTTLQGQQLAEMRKQSGTAYRFTG